MVFPKANAFEIRELELESPGSDDIVVKTLVTAISPGTERWVLKGRHLGTVFPNVPGYHRIGIVEECGKNVKNFRPGDVVYGSGNRWKGEVKPMFGAHVGMSVGDWRGYSFIAPAIPTRLELETQAFAIVAGVANRGMRYLKVQPYQKMVIIGAGFIGLCAAQMAQTFRAEPVLVDIDEDKIALAKYLGLNALNGARKETDGELKKIAPGGFDILYDTVGDAPTTDRMVPLTRQRGTMCLQAQYFDKERCAIDLDQIKIRELQIVTSCGIDDVDMVETLAQIKNRTLKIDAMITHRFEAKDALKGYELLLNGKPFNLGVVFRWDERVK